MNKMYNITSEQLSEIQHTHFMLEQYSKRIADLCSQEQADVVYGFELGQLHNDIQQKRMDLFNLMSEISRQEYLEVEDKSCPDILDIVKYLLPIIDLDDNLNDNLNDDIRDQLTCSFQANLIKLKAKDNNIIMGLNNAMEKYLK